ncbi:CMGC protein kinase [Aspergillus terreus]|uniref:CMGC protein kinase n=1 Tax=Aspergillus terreus TaxID=33178 RepID=A0A5M3ZEZ4_ASPTE|nr:hypothetical protein ATETN484_0014002200 [Aspergillus terreus]GFF20688.1 CMGC protein kinase [Aspergillus terreus]
MAGNETPSTGVPTVESYAKNEETAEFSDFVDNEDDQIDLEDIAEPWHKYLVEHKIGFGGFSTVWKAHDLQEKGM